MPEHSLTLTLTIKGRLFVLRGPSGDVNSVGVGVVAVEETPIAADFYTENEIAILTKPSTGGIMNVYRSLRPNLNPCLTLSRKFPNPISYPNGLFTA